MTSASRIEPDGAMTAVQPASAAATKPSGKREEPVARARRAAGQSCRPVRRRSEPHSRDSFAPRRCRAKQRRARRATPLDFTCRTTSQAKIRSRHSPAVGGALRDDPPGFGRCSRIVVLGQHAAEGGAYAQFLGDPLRHPGFETHDAQVLLPLQPRQRVGVEGRRRDDLEKELAQRFGRRKVDRARRPR